MDKEKLNLSESAHIEQTQQDKDIRMYQTRAPTGGSRHSITSYLVTSRFLLRALEARQEPTKMVDRIREIAKAYRNSLSPQKGAVDRHSGLHFPYEVMQSVYYLIPISILVRPNIANILFSLVNGLAQPVMFYSYRLFLNSVDGISDGLYRNIWLRYCNRVLSHTFMLI